MSEALSLDALIHQRLAALNPQEIHLHDDSAAHAGHAGAGVALHGGQLRGIDAIDLGECHRALCQAQQIDDGQDRLPAFFDAAPPPGVNLDDNEDALIGRAIPGALAFLGVTFGICASVVAGLPPFSGFVAKLAMLQALLQQGSTPAWALFTLIIVSGLFAATALLRVGIRHFWGASDKASPKLRVIETLPIGALLAASVMLVVWGEPALRYVNGTADALHTPERYIRAVMSARPVNPASEDAP